MKFNHLTAIEIDWDRTTNAKGVFWFCKCDCGNPNLKSVHMSHLKKGETTSCGCVHDKPGDRNPNWKGGRTREAQSARSSKEYKKWCSEVYRKDWYTCQCCGESKDIAKNAHHIKSFAKHKDTRYDIQNGITMCSKCHYSSVEGSFHNIYGTNNNTPEQLEEYINTKRKQLGLNIKFSLKDYLDGINILKPNQIGG